MTPDAGFDGRVPGHLFAQPLFWRTPDGRGLLIVATEDDVILALNADSGEIVWQRRLGTPVPVAALPRGDIDPAGITGTPVIDPSVGAIYMDAMVNTNYGPRHDIFGLRLVDGAVLPGWPLDVGTALTARGILFSPATKTAHVAGLARWSCFPGLWPPIQRVRTLPRHGARRRHVTSGHCGRLGDARN